MADTQWLTQAQYDLLHKELTERIEIKRPEIAKLIDAARQEGDLRENGGYHAARNEQSMNETRIQTLQEMLASAEVGETPADDGIVEPGMVVTALVETWACRSSLRRLLWVPRSPGTRRATRCHTRPQMARRSRSRSSQQSLSLADLF